MSYTGRTREDWIIEYQRRQALWWHDGNRKRPHALLSSGNHSSGFFNSRPVIEDEKLLRDVAHDLVDQYILAGWNLKLPDGVVGPQTGATRLAKYISDEFAKRRGYACQWYSPAKVGEGDAKKFVFDDPERMVKRGDMVLPCEDVITTGGSTELVESAVHDCGGRSINTVLAIVNRSGHQTVGRTKQVHALITEHMPIWTPEECPLCKQGSKAVRPKENWAELTAYYPPD